MRFNPTNYNPADDSSPGAPSNGNLVLIYKDDQACRCGCGGAPKNPKRRFIQGHDARLKGMLIRAAVTDTTVEIRQGKEKPATLSATSAAKVFGWGQVATAKARHTEAERTAKAKAAERAKVTAAKRDAITASKATKAAEKAKAAKAKAVAKRDSDRTKAAAKKATKKAPAKKAPAAKKAAAPKAAEPSAEEAASA
jgi:histone H1/5